MGDYQKRQAGSAGVSVAVPLSNRYTILDTVEGDSLSGENTSSSQAYGTTPGSAVEQGRAKVK